MALVSVRPATAADAAEITRIQRVTWRAAYAELLPEQAIAALDDPAATGAWAAAIAEPAAVVLLAEEGAWTVGCCVAGPAPADALADADGALPPDGASTALIGTLLVEPRWGRRGHGGRLLRVAADRLHRAGAIRAITWVPDSDSASLAFYRKAGWSADGIVRTLDAHGRPLREIRLSAPLPLPADTV